MLKLWLMKQNLKQLFKDRAQDESGQTIIEYVLILALIVLAALAGFPEFGSKIAAVFSTVGDKLTITGKG